MNELRPEQRPLGGTPEEKIGRMFDVLKQREKDAPEARKKSWEGIVEAPQSGRTYVRFTLQEGQLGRGFTFGDDERGGDVLEVPNGAFIELDKKGLPVNPVLRERVESGELDLEAFPRLKGSETQADGEDTQGTAEKKEGLGETAA